MLESMDPLGSHGSYGIYQCNCQLYIIASYILKQATQAARKPVAPITIYQLPQTSRHHPLSIPKERSNKMIQSASFTKSLAGFSAFVSVPPSPASGCLCVATVHAHHNRFLQIFRVGHLKHRYHGQITIPKDPGMS